MKEIKNLANIGLGDILGSGISAVFWFYLAILIMPKNYGEIQYFISIAGIISYLALFGSQNTITVYVAKKIPIQSTFNLISLSIGVLGFVFFIVIFNRIDLGFLVLGYVISNLVLGEILGNKEYENYLKYVLIQKSLTPIFGLSFFFIFGIEWVIFGLALSYVTYSFRIFKSFKNVKIDFSLLPSRKGFIINNYLYALSGTLHGQIDKIIIMPVLGATLLGNYSLSLQIISIMMIFSSIFYKYLLSQEASGKSNQNVKKILILISIILTLVGFFVVPILLPKVFPQYIESIDAIKIMSLSLVPMSLVKIYTSKFLGKEKSRYILIGTVISLSVLIPTMVLFGIWYQVIGIAASFVLSMIIQSAYFFYVNKKIDGKIL
jgi:O-antigen/teichoic acid export membrane protein